jgi:hypothetical protein
MEANLATVLGAAEIGQLFIQPAKNVTINSA